MNTDFRVGDIVTRRGDDLHRILQISSCGDSMLVECIRPDKGDVVDDDGTRSDPCYKIGDQEWNLPRRYSYPEFMTIEGEAAHRQAYGIADASKTRMLPTLRPATLEPYQEAFIREMLAEEHEVVTVMVPMNGGYTYTRGIEAYMAKLSVDRLKEMATQIDTAAAAAEELDRRAEAFADWAKEIPFAGKVDPEACRRRVIGPDGLWMCEVGGAS